MSRATMTDSRVLSLADAKQLFNELAQKEIAKAKAEAQTEAKIAALKTAHQERVEPLTREIATLVAQLDAFILGHPAEFKEPREQVTDFGKFGLRTVPAGVKVTSEDLLVDYAREKGYLDLFEEAVTVKKPAVLKRLKAGEQIPGTELVPAGERSGYTVAKALLEQAAE